VQDSRPGAFDPDALAAFQAMADQVAVALDNARLFTENQAALEASRRAYGVLSRQAWIELLHNRGDWGYRYTHQSVAPITDEWPPEILQAVQAGQRVQPGPGPFKGEEGGNEAALAVPLKVRDQVVGALSFRKSESKHTWAAEEVALLETLTEQLGLALESARLYQDTQRRAARERLTREITDQMRRATSVEGIVQTTVDALFNVLETSRAFACLEAAPEAGDDGADGISHPS
jgi:GAF domain-containing protein